MMQANYVGKRLPRGDAHDKVTGRAVYINDLSRPGQLYGRILYSEHPHAVIKNIDVSKAKALPGVRAVITGEDIPEIPLGFMKDNRPLKKGKVRSLRDEVAAVAATDPDTAAQALELIRVDYEPLPGVFDPKDALEENAPLIHEIDPRGRPASNNILPVPWKLECGDIKAGKAAAVHEVESDYSTTFVSHCCLGASGVIAEFDFNKNLTMYSITQIPYLAQNDYLAALKALGIKDRRVRVRCQTIGGGFGSKLDTHCYEFIAILLAYATAKPVKIQFSREEEFLAQATRQPTLTRISQGCDENGRLTFRKVRMLLDNGAYTSWGATTPSVMMVPISSLYRVPNISYQAKIVYTNNLYSQAFRGYGNPQATFAVESNMDELARKAGIDPFEFRLLNSNLPGETSPQKFVITSCGLKQCLEQVRDGLGWDETHEKPDLKKATKLRGKGVASLIHVGGGARVYRSDGHGMIMKLDDFGNLSVLTGAVEIGQGNETVLRQMVADAVGIELDRVTIVAHDTDICPWDVGTHASRQAFISGNAAIKCARELRSKIFEAASGQMGFSADELDLTEGIVHAKGIAPGPESGIPLAKILRKAHYSTQGKMIIAETFYDPPNQMLDKEMKGNISCAYSFGAHGVEVEVDTETGQVRILNYQAAHDVGKALNPMLLEGQIYGAAVMGAGFALSENLILDQGRVMNPSFRDYMVPTAKDQVPVTPIIVETEDPAGPFGAKGVGEPGCVPSAPAIANAIFDAIGLRPRQLPMTPERILRLIKKAREQ